MPAANFGTINVKYQPILGFILFGIPWNGIFCDQSKLLFGVMRDHPDFSFETFSRTYIQRNNQVGLHWSGLH